MVQITNLDEFELELDLKNFKKFIIVIEKCMFELVNISDNDYQIVYVGGITNNRLTISLSLSGLHKILEELLVKSKGYITIYDCHNAGRSFIKLLDTSPNYLVFYTADLSITEIFQRSIKIFVKG